MIPSFISASRRLSNTNSKDKDWDYKMRIIDVHVNGIIPLFTGKGGKPLKQ